MRSHHPVSAADASNVIGRTHVGTGTSAVAVTQPYRGQWHWQQGAKGRLDKAEQALERILDAQLGYQRTSHADEDSTSTSSGFPASFKDDYVDSDREADSSEVCGGAIGAPQCRFGPADVKKRKLGVEPQSTECKEGSWEAVVDDSHPPSFSEVDLGKPEKDIQTQFPLFPVSPFVVWQTYTGCGSACSRMSQSGVERGTTTSAMPVD